VDEKTIHPDDLDLIQVLDKPQQVVDAIFDYYSTRGFEPSEEEQEQLLEL
jgi:predicted Rossmann-fold nucleotide-binding protein